MRDELKAKATKWLNLAALPRSDSVVVVYNTKAAVVIVAAMVVIIVVVIVMSESSDEHSSNASDHKCFEAGRTDSQSSTGIRKALHVTPSLVDN